MPDDRSSADKAAGINPDDINWTDRLWGSFKPNVPGSEGRDAYLRGAAQKNREDAMAKALAKMKSASSEGSEE